MQEVRATITDDGKLAIPSEYLQSLGIKIGDEVILRLEAEGVRILIPPIAIARAQALIRQYIPAGRQLSAELIQQRREESQRE
jgi:bifunctional DNA-binding transcriptional regulator/antitoxin component of YhaV-PrlF toxin-antitoxin module